MVDNRFFIETISDEWWNGKKKKIPHYYCKDAPAQYYVSSIGAQILLTKQIVARSLAMFTDLNGAANFLYQNPTDRPDNRSQTSLFGLRRKEQNK